MAPRVRKGAETLPGAPIEMEASSHLPWGCGDAIRLPRSPSTEEIIVIIPDRRTFVVAGARCPGELAAAADILLRAARVVSGERETDGDAGAKTSAASAAEGGATEVAERDLAHLAVALRYLVGRAALDEGPPTPQLGTGPPTFRVDAGGTFFVLPNGTKVSCHARAIVQRLLRVLTEGRLHSPGVPLSANTLVQAGWPDEKILSWAAKNRLRVALSWLRKRGWGSSLITQSNGYFFDPNVTIEIISDDAMGIHPSRRANVLSNDLLRAGPRK
ncbi:hypothetical protein [Pendulispora albinea]|uniref:OmpR/PhoB-type domain-containing protein n=1 Tax=Pendulispora albinea TaxID=2741071 RepID=A0ABZ2M2Y8_9BACT